MAKKKAKKCNTVVFRSKKGKKRKGQKKRIVRFQAKGRTK